MQNKQKWFNNTKNLRTMSGFIAAIMVGSIILANGWLNNSQKEIPRGRRHVTIEWEHPIEPREIASDTTQFSLLWVNSDVYIPKSHETPYLTIASDKVVFLGSLNQNEHERLTAFDLQDGMLAWMNPIDENIASAFSSDQDQIYVGFHSAIVKAYDPLTGNIIWDVKLPGTKMSDGFISARPTDISVLTAEETKLFVRPDTSNVMFFYPKTGVMIENQVDYVDSDTVHVDSEILLFQPLNSQILANDAQTGQLKWRFKFDDLYIQQTPIVNDDFVILKAGPLPLEALGSIWFFDKNSGDVVWTSSVDVGSNPAISGNHLFYLTMDARLHVIDMTSGKEFTSLQFLPNQLDDLFLIRESHVVASNDIVVVYFGDSAQLFALRMESSDAN